jgi:hypothetical protein
MIASIIRSKTYLLSLPPLERASAVEAYALSLKSTFKAMALVGVLALVAAWPIEERALGTVLLVFCMSAYLADIPNWRSVAQPCFLSQVSQANELVAAATTKTTLQHSPPTPGRYEKPKRTPPPR